MNFTRHHDPKTRLTGIGFVVLFHVLLVWGLVAGLAHKALELLPQPIETKIIDEVKPPPDEPPPPKPDFQPPPPPYVPPPDINIAVPVETGANAIQQITKKATGPVPPSIDLKHSPNACKKPEYPTASERLGEAGIAAISLLIGVDGSVQQSRIDQTSNFKRLDEATIKAFSKCKFNIGSNNGVPEASWFSMRYKWVVPK